MQDKKNKKKPYKTSDKSSEFSPPKKPKTYNTIKTGEKAMFTDGKGGKPKEYEVVNKGRAKIPSAGASPLQQGLSFEDQLIYDYQKAEEYRGKLKSINDVYKKGTAEDLPKSGEVYFDRDGKWKRAGESTLVDGKLYKGRDEILDENQLRKENALIDWDAERQSMLQKAMHEAGAKYENEHQGKYGLKDQFSTEGKSIYGDDRTALDAFNEHVPITGSFFAMQNKLKDKAWRKRIESGNATVEDMENWGVLQKQLEREHGKDWWFKAADIGLDAPKFMLEIQATGGMGSVAAAVKSGGLLKGAGALAKQAPVTSAKMPYAVAERAVDQSMNDPYTMEGSEDDWSKNIVKGYIDHTIEIASEMSGALMGTGGLAGKGLEKAGEALNRLAPEKLSSLIKSAVAKIPKDEVLESQLLQKFRNAGFDGTFEEYLEERVGDVLRGATSLAPTPYTDLETGFGTTGDIAKGLSGDVSAADRALDQTFSELAAFGAMSAGRRVAGKALVKLKEMKNTPSRREWAEIFLGDADLYEQAPSRKARYRQFQVVQNLAVEDLIKEGVEQDEERSLNPETQSEAPLDENLTEEEQQEVDDWKAANEELLEQEIEQAPEQEFEPEVEQGLGFEDSNKELQGKWASEEPPVLNTDSESTAVTDIDGRNVDQGLNEVPPEDVGVDSDGVPLDINKEVSVDLEDQQDVPQDVPQVEPEATELSPEEQYIVDRDDMINTLNNAPINSVNYQHSKISPREPQTEEEQGVKQFLDSIGQPFSFVNGGSFAGIASRKGGFMLLNGKGHQVDLWQTVGHELAHTEGFDRIIPAGNARLEEAKQRYMQLASPMLAKILRENPDKWNREARANIVGDFIRDKSFRDKLEQSDPTMFDQIIDFIVELMGDFTPTQKAKQIILEELRQKKKSIEEAKQLKEAEAKQAAEEEAERKAFEEALGGVVENDEEAGVEPSDEEAGVEPSDEEAGVELSDEEAERKAFEEALGGVVEDDEEDEDVEQTPPTKSTGKKPTEPSDEEAERKAFEEALGGVVEDGGEKPIAQGKTPTYSPSADEIANYVVAANQNRMTKLSWQQDLEKDKPHTRKRKAQAIRELKRIKFFEENIIPLLQENSKGDKAFTFGKTSHSYKIDQNFNLVAGDAARRMSNGTLKGDDRTAYNRAFNILTKSLPPNQFGKPDKELNDRKNFIRIGTGYGATEFSSSQVEFKPDAGETAKFQSLIEQMQNIGSLSLGKPKAKPKSTGKKPKPVAEKPKPKPKSTGEKPKPKTDIEKAADDVAGEFDWMPSEMSEPQKPAAAKMTPKQRTAIAKFFQLAMNQTNNNVEEAIKLLDEKTRKEDKGSFVAAFRHLLEPAIKGFVEFRQKKDPSIKLPNLVKVINQYEKENPLVKGFADKLRAGHNYKDINEARKEAGAIIGEEVKAGTVAAKEVDEAMERAVVLASREIAASDESDVVKYERLTDLYDRHPILGVRTSTSAAEQMFSTPAPLAFVASRAANVNDSDVVYDSAAGNGMLLIEARLDKAFANETNKDRNKALEELGVGTVTQLDANEIEKSEKVDKVIINPPFGKLKDEQTKVSKSWTVDGVTTMERDHSIALRTLKSLRPDGKAVLIIKSRGIKHFGNDNQRSKSYRNSSIIDFYDKIYDKYNVTDHYTIGGELYRKQGASFPVDVIVIDGIGESKRPKPYNVLAGGVPELIKDWETLKNEKLNKTPKLAVQGQGTSVESTEPQLGSDSGSSTSVGQPTDTGRIPSSDEGTTSVDGGTRRESEGDTGTKPVRESGDSDRPTGTGVGGAISGQVNEGDVGRGRGTGDRGVSNEGEKQAPANRRGKEDKPKKLGDKPNRELEETVFQKEYTVTSRAPFSLGTLVPTNHVAAIKRAMESIESEHGQIDEFVAKELQYGSAKEMHKYLAAEQVDAVAMAIHNHMNGSAFIIGDQTGIGKGRVVASMIRYAKIQGFVPVFVTEKPTLYDDMLRDLMDIGMNGDENPFPFFATDSKTGKEAISLKQDGKGRFVRGELADKKRQFVELINNSINGDGLFFSSPTKDDENAVTKVDAIFTTYSQIQPTKNDKFRLNQFMKLAKNAYFILDESHSAGAMKDRRTKDGEEEVDLALGMRQLLELSAGAFYSSATFAKRPSLLDLYFKTDISKAVEDIKELTALIKDGGVPFQQVISEMLVEAGQYIRRERSYAGIEFEIKKAKANRSHLDEFSKYVRELNDFSILTQAARDNFEPSVTSIGGTMYPNINTDTVALNSLSFGSLMHNLVDAAMFGLKAQHAADEAIASLKRGEQPVIAVDNTMGSILNEFLNLNPEVTWDDPIKFDFKTVLNRFLKESKMVTVKFKEQGSDIERTQRIPVPEEMFSKEAKEQEAKLIKMIGEWNLPIPASPIDYIRSQIERAGYSVKEITGRDKMVTYPTNRFFWKKESGKFEKPPMTLIKRDKAKAESTDTIKEEFNSGKLDAIILNRAGSTGISLHASDKNPPEGQKPRHMIIAQADKNVDKFVQMLGRIHRTGQVALPRFTLLMLDAPAETRPATNLVSKLSSLNANVTGGAKGAISFDAPDIFNSVGDGIVMNYMENNRHMNTVMGNYVKQNDAGQLIPRSAAQITGKAILMPLSMQEEFWDEITREYIQTMNDLDNRGMNPFSAEALDLQAKVLERVEIKEGEEDSDNPFLQSAFLDKVSVLLMGRPMSSKEVKEKVDAYYEVPENFAQSVEDKMTSLANAHKQVRPEGISDSAWETRLSTTDRQLARVLGMLRAFPVGKSVRFKDTLQNYDGVIVGLEHINPKKAGGASPVAPSRWIYAIAVQDSLRVIKVPMSKHENLEVNFGLEMSNFDKASEGATREERYMVTGNLVSGKEEVKDDHGRVVFFSKARPAGKVVSGKKGRKFIIPVKPETSRGILMPREFSPTRWAERKPVVVRKGDAEAAMEMLRRGINLVTVDGLLEVKGQRRNENEDYKPKLVARRKGKKYWQAKRILETLDGETPEQRQFVTSGNKLKATGKGVETLEAILKLDILQVNGDKALARRVLEQVKSQSNKDTSDQPSEMSAPKDREGRAEGKKDKPLEVFGRQSRDYGQNDRDLRETIAADDIIKTLNNFFDASVFAGRIRSKATLGWFNFIQKSPKSPESPEVIRLKEKILNNLAVYVHELAHHLDQKFKFTTNKGKAGLIPRDIIEELRPLDYEPEKGRPTEGFAEFFRIYITEPNTTVLDSRNYPVVVPVAQTLAPKMVDWFENKFSKMNPELWEKITKAREYSQDYARQSVWQRVSTIIGNRQPRDLSWRDEWKERQRHAVSNLKKRYVDQFHTLAEVQSAAELKGYKGIGIYDATMAYFMTASSAASVAFEEGVRGLAQDEQIGQTSLWGLRDLLENDREYDQAIMYALARHTVFMNKKMPNYNTGMDVEDAKQLLSQAEEANPEQAKRFTKFAQGIAQFGNDLLLMQAKAGVMSADEAFRIIQHYGGLNYFPLHRVQEERSGLAQLLGLPASQSRTFLGTQAGIVNLPNPIRGRSEEGSGRRIIDPIDAMIAKTFKAYQTAIQARMITHLVKTLDTKLGGVGGLGGLMVRVEPNVKVTTETVRGLLKQLMKLNILDQQDVDAMDIAHRIKSGEYAFLTPIEKMLFAKRHQVYLINNGLTWETATESDYQKMAENEPDPLALISIYKPDFTPNAQKRVVRVSLPAYSRDPLMYQVDQDLYETISGMSVPEMEVFSRVMQGAGRVFKTGAVGVSTVFGASNFIRDILEGYAKQKHTKGKLKSLTAPFDAIGKYLAVKALSKMGAVEDSDSDVKKRLAEYFGEKNLTADNPMVRLYEQSGSKLYSRIGHDMNSQSRARKNRVGGFNHSKFGITQKAIRSTGNMAVSVYQGLQDSIAVTDAPVRLAEGEAAIKEDGFIIRKNRWYHEESGEYVNQLPEATRIKASLAMAEASVNFKRIGSVGRGIETYVPFFNATIQSQYRQYMQLKSAGRVAKQLASGEQVDEQEATQAKKLLVYYAALVAAETLLYFMIADGDDDREKDPYLKELYWSWGKNGKTYWRVPKPRDAAFVTNATRYILDSQFADPKERDKVGSLLFNELFSRLPVGGGVVRGSVEVFADYDFFRNAPLTPMSVQNDPSALQTSDYTTTTSDAIGKVTGKYLGLSPIQMQHLLNSATGGQYRAQTDRMDKLMNGNLSFRDLPFVKAVSIERMGGKSVSRFYEKKQKLHEDKAHEESNFPKYQARLSDDLIKELAVSDFVYSTMRDIRKLETRRGKKRSQEYQKYIIGLARNNLGYEELESYPDPFKSQDMPKPMQSYVEKTKQNKVANGSEALGKEKDYTEEKWYERRKNHLRAIEQMKLVAPNYSQAKELLKRYRDDGNITFETYFTRLRTLKGVYNVK